MHILNATSSHLKVLTAKHQQDFTVPNLNNPYVIAARTACSDSHIIAMGIVRMTTEGILIIDESQPLIKRVNAVDSLIQVLKADISKKGMDECHAFASDKIVSFLERQGFIHCKGVPMVLQWQNENVKKQNNV